MKKIITLLLAAILSALLLLLAFAGDNNFTASVTAKAAPEIVTVKDDEYKGSVAIIKDKSGKIIEGVGGEFLQITPVSDSEQLSDEDKEELEKAFDEIQKADAVYLLDESFKKIVEEVNPDIAVEKYIVRDLFDLKLSDKYLNMLGKDDQYVEVTFRVNVEKDVTVFVMTKCPGVGWKTNESKNVINNGDGTVTVRFYSLCPVAFVVADPAAVAAAKNGDNTTDTPEETAAQKADVPAKSGASDNIIMYSCIAAAAGIAIIVIIIIVKKKNSKDAEENVNS